MFLESLFEDILRSGIGIINRVIITHCFGRNSFPVYLRVSLATLVVTIKDITPGRQSDATELKLDRLLKWNLAVRVFHILVNLIKAFDARSNLIAILKVRIKLCLSSTKGWTAVKFRTDQPNTSSEESLV